MTMYGADANALEALASRMRSDAAELDRLRVTLRSRLHSSPWRGPNADRFRAEWDGPHTTRLVAAANAMRAAGERLAKNAAEQRSASTARGVMSTLPAPVQTLGGVGTIPAIPGFAGILRSVDGKVELLAILTSALAVFPGLKYLDAGGNTFAAFSAGTSGWSAGEHLVQGKYVDAGLDVALGGGDIGAFALKQAGMKSGNAVAYVGGMAVQSVTEAGKAAREVDWSANGMEQLQHASLHDWADGLQYSAKKLPLKIAKIFLP